MHGDGGLKSYTEIKGFIQITFDLLTFSHLPVVIQQEQTAMTHSLPVNSSTHAI